jgi:pyruvate, water dikinase
MDLAWNGILTCDYERTRPLASRLELDLYTRSLIAWPQVMLADPSPYGRLRRPGIVDIPEPDHRKLTAAWHRKLGDPAYAQNLILQATRDRDTAALRLGSLERALAAGDRASCQAAVEAATEAVLRVMSTHIVNWLLPEDQWECRLAALLGDRGRALACMSALQLPAEPGHILAAPGDHGEAQNEAIAARRAAAAASRDSWRSAALQAAEGDPSALEHVRVISGILQWAATSEERRNELRERYLALARSWAGAAPRPFRLLSVAGLLPEKSAPPGSVWLGSAAGLGRHGGKASALARLIQEGLPVPGGLVIPAETRDDELPALIGALCEQMSPLPEYGFAVRSSAPREDGVAASFAGVYASRFAVPAPVALLEAVRDVRSSAHSPAAVAYARAHRLEPCAGMAVILQSALRPYAAGVLTGRLDRDELASWSIQAVYGLAEPLASGTQAGELHQPGRLVAVLDQDTAVLPARPAERSLPPGDWTYLPLLGGKAIPAKVLSASDALLTVYLPDELAAAPLITPPLRDELLRLAAVAAASLHLTVIDMEWAVTPDGTVYLLQARQVTAAPASAPDQHPVSRHGAWSGIPGAPGIARGPVRHLSDNTTCDVEGSILVCDNMGPDALSALLRRPGGILATSGGTLSHAAIVARELGIPCITAMPRAIRALPEGTILNIDGSTGIASLREP